MCKELTLQKADELIARYPQLHICRDSLLQAIKAMCQCYKVGGKVIVCGNGGSASDAEHIVGELMKGFIKKRPLNEELYKKMQTVCPEESDYLYKNPFLSSSINSGIPPIRLPIIGFPISIASRIEYGQFSYQIDGNTINLDFFMYSLICS